MAGATLAGQKSLNSFRDTPTFTASQALVNVVNTGQARTFSAAEAGMIARLLRATLLHGRAGRGYRLSGKSG